MPPPDKTYKLLLDLLNSGEHLSYKQAARLVEVSDRHIRRLFDELSANNIPVRQYKSGRSLVFYIDEQDRELGVRLRLTESQAFALTVAVEASRSTFAPTPLGSSLAEVFTHLLEQLPAEILSFEAEEIPQHWHFSGGLSVVFNPEFFTGLSRAIIECRRIKIDYYTASKGGHWSYNRPIDPYGLAIRNGIWILVAFCREKMEMREFNPVGIAKLEPTDEYFLRPEGFDLKKYFGNRFNAVGGDGTYCIRLLVEQNRAAYFDRKIYHHTQVIEKRLEDKSLIVRYIVDGLQEMRSFVQSWGSGVTVLEPEELRTIIRQEAEAIAHRYA